MIEIYTDGSAVAAGENIGRGGYGVVFTINGEVKKTIGKGFQNTKTGRMELSAALKALKILRKDQKATIISDSMYVVNTFEERWIFRWEMQGWSCKNSDIMKELLEEYKKFPPRSIRFKHVKGHSGNKFNELADSIASYKNYPIEETELDLP